MHQKVHELVASCTSPVYLAFSKKKAFEVVFIDSQLSFHLDEQPLQTVNQTVHLGIIRADKNETNLNIQEHISIARKTLYSLIPVGLNGKNGLDQEYL
jgi:hypothetical protein